MNLCQGEITEVSLTVLEQVSFSCGHLRHVTKGMTAEPKGRHCVFVLLCTHPAVWSKDRFFFYPFYCCMLKRKRFSSIYWNYCLAHSSLNSLLTQKVLCRLLFWARFSQCGNSFIICYKINLLNKLHLSSSIISTVSFYGLYIMEIYTFLFKSSIAKLTVKKKKKIPFPFCI